MPTREQLARALAQKHLDLADVRIQHAIMYGKGWDASDEKTLGGRQHSADTYALDAKIEELRIIGDIESLKVSLDFGLHDG